jgi:hypothetical protein
MTLAQFCLLVLLIVSAIRALVDCSGLLVLSTILAHSVDISMSFTQNFTSVEVKSPTGVQDPQRRINAIYVVCSVEKLVS